MNKIKRLFSLIITFVLSLSFTGILSLKANEVPAEVHYSENGKGTWQVTEETNENIYGMNYTHAYGMTSASGAVNKQQVNIFDMKTDGTYSKIVNWAIQDSPNSFKRATIMDIARDYEEKHPGWIVLGGINADQYAMTEHYGGSKSPIFPQPFYPLIMDGERRYMTGLFGTTNNFVGFSNNPSNPFIYESARLGYYVCIYNEDNVEVSRTFVEGFNQEASGTGTTVWMPYKNQAGSSYICNSVSGNLYVVENPELQYVSNCPEYGVEYNAFGRGYISKITNEHTLKEVEFLIQTNDDNLKAQLQEGTKVIVQGVYENEDLNNVEFSAGFHSAQRLNNKDVEATASYDTQTYSRSIFGRKADGSYVLVTVDLYNGQYKGMTQDESNAMLASYGVVEAYQQDGGGSVTACVRNSIGTFDLVNKPKDGSTRTVFNGLFFAVRDPGFRVKNVSNTRNSIYITKEETLNSSLIKNAKVEVSGKTYDLNDVKTEISGLQEDTQYVVTFKFDMYNDKTKVYEPCTYSVVTKTKAFNIPSSGLKVTDVDKNSIVLTKSESEFSEHISNVVLNVDYTDYNIGSSTEYVIEGLLEDTKYNATITYDVYDPESGNTYKGTETIEFTTLKNALPRFNRFEIVRVSDTRITFGFDIQDKDDVVSQAFLYYNKEKMELTNMSGTISINDLDLKAKEYTFYIQVYYNDGKAATLKKLTSEKIVYGTNSETKSITYVLDGGTLDENAPEEYVVGVGLSKLPTVTKEGYIFKGWKLNGEVVTSISTTSNEDITLTATWEAEPEEPSTDSGSSGCSMTSVKMILSLTASMSLFALLLRKRK